jgi:hypothetical protein
MPCLEILHEVTSLLGTGFADSSSNQVCDNIVRLHYCKNELADFADGRNRVEVRLS